MSTKISVTIEDSTLEWLRGRAKRVHGGNLSAAIAEVALVARKQEALRAFLQKEGVPPLSKADLDEIVAEWAPAKPRPRRQRTPKRAAAKR
jgi:hypothetical protein